MTSHTQKIFFEWESSFWNKILLQWWGWIIGAVYFSRAFLLLLCRTVGWDWPTGILMMINIMTSHTQKMFLSGSLHFGIKFYCSDEDESSKERSCVPAADTFCRTVGFCSKGTRFRPLEPTGTWIPGGWAPTSNPSIFRAFSAQPKVSDCTSKNWFRAACSGR